MSSLQLLPPSHPVSGSIRLGGSKSLTNRLLILAAVSGSDVQFTNLSDAEDCVLLRQALHTVRHSKKATLNVHHSGADLRFLCAFLCTTEGEWLLTGSARLCERPVAGLVNALRELGADIQYTDQPEHPPLRIIGQKLKGGKVKLNADVSSQYVSALMLSAPQFSNGLEIELLGRPVSFSYVSMSARLIEAFGYTCKMAPGRIFIPSGRSLPAVSSIAVESDWSSASYWYGLCALSPGSALELSELYPNSTQADSIAVQLFEKLGVQSRLDGKQLLLHQNSKAIQPEFEHDFSDCPDLAPAIACTCFGLGIETRLKGLKTLQLKESRRIDVLKSELMKLGAKVEAGQDYLNIEAHSFKLTPPAEIDTCQDHRIAMAFATLSLKFPGLVIRDPDVVNKSYPQFWQDLQSLGFHLNLQT